LLSNGAKTLSEKEMEFMFPGDPDLNNWISDYDLAKDKEADWFWPDLYSFSPTPDISDK
jgi:hypothetical protein